MLDSTHIMWYLELWVCNFFFALIDTLILFFVLSNSVFIFFESYLLFSLLQINCVCVILIFESIYVLSSHVFLKKCHQFYVVLLLLILVD